MIFGVNISQTPKTDRISAHRHKNVFSNKNTRLVNLRVCYINKGHDMREQRMFCHENTPYDFSLVSTYLPVFVIVIRGAMCACVVNWCLFTMNMPLHAVMICIASIVYVDSLIMHNNAFDRACGHLGVCAMATLAQQNSRECSTSETAFIYVCDLLWCACAGFEVIAQTSSIRVHMSYISKVIICCMFASMRVAFSCTEIGLMQSLFRSCLYYVLCSLVILCRPFVLSVTTVQGSFYTSVVYICAHLFFVHLYAVVVSVAIIVGVHSRLLYKSLRLDNDKMTYVHSVHGLHSLHNSSKEKYKDLGKDNIYYAPHENGHTKNNSHPENGGTQEDHLYAALQAAKLAHGIH